MSAVGGLVGAAIATVACEIIGALGFPTAGTLQPFADSAIPRALAQALIPLGFAPGAVATAGGRRGSRPPGLPENPSGPEKTCPGDGIVRVTLNDPASPGRRSGRPWPVAPAFAD